MLSRFRPAPRRAAWKVLGVALAGWGFVVAGIFGYEFATLRASRDEITSGTGTAEPLLEFQMPGIDRPPTVRAGASTIAPDEEVIGFEVGGKARAYRLDAFRDRSKHVVNDLVDGIPVTVAYCDINDCLSAYKGREGADPLDVSVGGLYENREMVLEVGGVLYFQKSGAPLTPGVGPARVPLEQLSPIRTTWAEWKRRHPSTDVYEGPP